MKATESKGLASEPADFLCLLFLFLLFSTSVFMRLNLNWMFVVIS